MKSRYSGLIKMVETRISDLKQHMEALQNEFTLVKSLDGYKAAMNADIVRRNIAQAHGQLAWNESFLSRINQEIVYGTRYTQ